MNGWISLEVDPHLAYDKDATVADATRGVRARLRRPLGGHDELRGTLAIANAKLAHQGDKELFDSEAWSELAQVGASAQRCLWASPSTSTAVGVTYSSGKTAAPLSGDPSDAGGERSAAAPPESWANDTRVKKGSMATSGAAITGGWPGRPVRPETGSSATRRRWSPRRRPASSAGASAASRPRSRPLLRRRPPPRRRGPLVGRGDRGARVRQRRASLGSLRVPRRGFDAASAWSGRRPV